MSNEKEASRLQIVALFPVFLQRRRRDWKSLADMIAVSGLSRRVFFLLRALVEEFPVGQTFTATQMQAWLFNPYATIFPYMADLPELVAAGYLTRDGEYYQLPQQSYNLMLSVEVEARAYLASLPISDEQDMITFLGFLMNCAIHPGDEYKPDEHRHRERADRFPFEKPIAARPALPLPLLEWAIYALWLARDDAHMSAWRAQGLTGPVTDLLTRLWCDEAHTEQELITVLKDSQRPADIQQGIAALAARGWLSHSEAEIRLTTEGKNARDGIEEETNRRYFTSWWDISHPEVMIPRLQKLIDQLR